MERRDAAHRDRQLDEAHRKLIGRERDLEALLAVVKENTTLSTRCNEARCS